MDAVGLLGGALLAQAGGRAGALCWGSAQASGIRANHARYCSLPSPSGELTMGTNPQQVTEVLSGSVWGQAGDGEMSRAWRMAVEVKDEPQPCCGTPLTALLPCREGCWTCWVWCLWAQQDSLDNSGTGVNVGEVQCGHCGSGW